MEKIAILVDGGFFRKRIKSIEGEFSGHDTAARLYKYCMSHTVDGSKVYDLYRIFYYDCPPIEKKVYHPLLRQTKDLKKTGLYNWMNEFLQSLREKRKVALRLGCLDDTNVNYTLKTDVVKQLCNGNKAVNELAEGDFLLNVKQKGVDMKIGTDIASIAYKKQVKCMVLISGDSDFVPAAKLARREGIDFILDPMWAPIKPDLQEHIDGLRSYIKKPNS